MLAAFYFCCIGALLWVIAERLLCTYEEGMSDFKTAQQLREEEEEEEEEECDEDDDDEDDGPSTGSRGAFST